MRSRGCFGYDAQESFNLQAFRETLDTFDIAILHKLRTDARGTNAELAWRGDFIAGYRAAINRHKIDLGVLAFIRLDAERLTGDTTRQRGESINMPPTIVSCHYISSSGILEVQVVVQDLEAFHMFALHKLLNLPNLKHMHTRFPLGEVQASGALPLRHLARPPST